MWFAVGVVVAVALAVGLSVLVAPLKIGLLNLTVPLIGLVIGGAIAGRSLRVGWHGMAGFAVAYSVTLPLVGLRLIGIQGMDGNEGFLKLVIDFAATGGVAFALMGALGVGLSGLGVRRTVTSAVVFGCAGVLGGVLLAATQSASVAGARDTNRILLIVGTIAYVAFPPALGGSVLTRQLASHAQLRPHD